MDRQTIDYVRLLTARDSKTLGQKALKVCEEAGELAEVVLPFENAAGTLHRFIDRSRILEEVVDTVLTVVSIAYQLEQPVDGLALERSAARAPLPAPPGGITRLGLEAQRQVGRLVDAVLELEEGRGAAAVVGAHASAATRAALAIADALGFGADDIDAMLNRKMVKWADLQAREAGARYPLPYEIHITVAEAEIESFRAACTALGVKPIVLDLHLAGGGVLKDVMTSSVYFGDNPGSLAELRRIADGLTAAGFTVVRRKIETVPWHPAAPSRGRGAAMPKDCYFEAHLNVLCTDDRRDLLKLIADGCGAHLSRNVFKRLDERTFTIMMTYRRYDGVFEEFQEKLDAIRKMLAAAVFETEKVVVEFSIYDTKVSHDTAWLSGQGG